MRAENRLETFRRMFGFVERDRACYYGGLIGVGVINLALNLTFAWLLARLTADIAQSHQTNETTMYVLLMLLFTVVLSAFAYLAMQALVNSVAVIVARIRSRMLTHALSVPLSVIASMHSGALLSLLNSDTMQAGNLYLAGLQKLVSSGVSGIGAAISVLLIDWRIGLFAIVSGACSVFGGLPFARPLYDAGKGVQNAKAAWLATISDLVSGISTIRSFGQERRFECLAAKHSHDWLKCGSRRVRLEATRITVSNALRTLHLLFLAFGAYLSVKNPARLPGFVSIMHLQNPIRGFFESCADYLNDIQTRLAASRRILDLLDKPVEQTDVPTCGTGEAVTNGAKMTSEERLGLKAVDLVYSHGLNDPIINGISFCTPATGVVLVSGPSGRGKTTLLKTILGLYPLSSGRLSFGGQSISDIGLESWRSLFSYIPQGNYVFSGTVYENILAGSSADQEDVIAAAKKAGAHTFISELPAAYSTEVLAEGNELSVGQQQRLAIARALIQNRPIIVMDEPTSALDQESRQVIRETVRQISQEKLVIIATHSYEFTDLAKVIIRL